MTLDNTSDNTPTEASDAPVKAPRRRATRKMAAPGVVAAPPTIEAPAPAADESVATAPVVTAKTAVRKAPAKRATRATKKAAAPVVAIAADDPADQPAQDAAKTVSPEAEQPTTVAPRSTNALLFQAADTTTRPRRRRAQSPAGPPRPAEQKPA
ncbi:MAG TPA: hypothetical protein VIK12_01135, partial [Pengzhenrongella sp.]